MWSIFRSFDTINHEILIDKLNHYGVRGLSLDWFKSYSTKMQQKTSIKGILSDSHFQQFHMVYRRDLYWAYFYFWFTMITRPVVHDFADDTNITYHMISLSKKSINLRSSHQKCPMKKSALRNSTKFTGKHLCQSLFFN